MPSGFFTITLMLLRMRVTPCSFSLLKSYFLVALVVFGVTPFVGENKSPPLFTRGDFECKLEKGGVTKRFCWL